MLLHLGMDAARSFREQCRQIDRLRFQLHASRGDALQVEQLVDQLQQVPAVACHRLEKIALLLGEGSAEILGQQEIGESDDAVERGAQLV